MNIYTVLLLMEGLLPPVEVGSLYHYLPGFIHPKGGWPAGISGCHQPTHGSIWTAPWFPWPNQATRASNAFGLLPTHLGRCHPEFKKTMAGMKNPSELVVSTHLKNICQIGSFSLVGVKIKCSKPPPSIHGNETIFFLAYIFVWLIFHGKCREIYIPVRWMRHGWGSSS